MNLMFWKKKTQDDIGVNNNPTGKISMLDFSYDSDRTGIPIDNSQHQMRDQISSDNMNLDFSQGYDQQSRFPDPTTPLDSVQSRMQPQQFDQGQQTISNDDLELINAKLDYIKAELDAIKQRIIKIEKIAEQESVNQDITKKKYSWY